MQELLGGAVQLAGRLDVQAQQPGQRQVDLLHLLEVQLVAETPDPLDLLRGERLLGGSSAKERPSAAQAPRSSSTYGELSLACVPFGMRVTIVGTLPPRLGPMCGIVGYVGDKQARDVVIEGLRRLEYRGYDSAGIAVVDDGTIVSDKQAGKLANLEKAIEETPLPPSTTGIGHTRWATHGAPNDTNAHPHLGQNGRVAVVHNGIIENFARLRDELERDGHDLRLRDRHRGRCPPAGDRGRADRSTSPRRWRRSAGRLEGAFTLVAMDAQDPSRVVAARRNSPLVVGIGRGRELPRLRRRRVHRAHP